MFRFWRRLVRKLNFNKYFNGLIWIIRNNCNQEVISKTENHKWKQFGKEIKLNFIQNTANYILGQYRSSHIIPWNARGRSDVPLKYYAEINTTMTYRR